MTTIRICGLFALAIFVLFAASPAAHAQTYTDLYNLGTNPEDPLLPARWACSPRDAMATSTPRRRTAASLRMDINTAPSSD